MWSKTKYSAVDMIRLKKEMRMPSCSWQVIAIWVGKNLLVGCVNHHGESGVWSMPNFKLTRPLQRLEACLCDSLWSQNESRGE